MTKYRIVPKKDFGNSPFLINGKMVSTGLVVIYNTGKYKGCNAMPGATWSQTIRDALQMIAVFEQCGGDTPSYNNNLFWNTLHSVNGAR